MTKLVLDGYIVKENTDDGRMFYFSDLPDCCKNSDGNVEFSVGRYGDHCFDFDAPIKEFVNVNNPIKCKITIELER